MFRGIYLFRFLLFFLLLSPGLVNGQEDTYGKRVSPLERIHFEPIFQLELWASFSHNQRVFEDSTQTYRPVEDRFNLMLRRARAGFQIEPYEGLKFRFIGSFDFIGRDLNAAHTGNVNSGARPTFDVWDARLQWKVFRERETLYLNAGWFRPNFSRESVTSPWQVTSFDKAWSMNYVRRQLVGLGPGAAPGVNIGGFAYQEGRKVNLEYNFGLFVPQYLAFSGASNGFNFSPVFVARGIIQLGEPEFKKYTLGHILNAFNERKGLSIGVGGFVEGKNDLFESNYGAQVDFLLNWGRFNLDGDFNFLWREGSKSLNGAGTPDRIFTTHFRTGHLRTSVNLTLGKFFLEPVFMFVYLDAPMDLQGQLDAINLLSRAGQHQQYDFGINWYLDRQKLKLSIHYVMNRGAFGELGPGAIGNNYLFQNGVGPILRGDYLGLGLNLGL